MWTAHHAASKSDLYTESLVSVTTTTLLVISRMIGEIK